MTRRLPVLLLLPACGAPPTPTLRGRLPEAPLAADAPVVARVDGHAIPLDRLQRATDAEGSAADPRSVLDDLVTLEILAREAERLGLADDPEVTAEARRVMAQLYVRAAFEAGHGRTEVPEATLRRAYEANSAFYNNPDVLLVTQLVLRAESKDPPERWEACRSLAGEARQLVVDLPDRSIKPLKTLAKSLAPRWPEASIEGPFYVARDSPFVPEFVEAAFALAEDGAVSEPVKTRFGYHVIVRDRFEPARSQPFEQVRPDVLDRMYDAWSRAEFRAWMEGLVARLATVDPGPLRALAGAAPGPDPDRPLP